MAKYEKIELSDLITNFNLKGKKVQVEGVVRGVQDRTALFNMRTGYTAFLENEDNVVLIQGSCDGYVGAMREISMVKLSSETGRKVILQGKVKGNYPEYKLSVHGARLAQYTSVGFEE